MSVSITSALRGELVKAGVDPVAFVMNFAQWRAGWPTNEYTFELFGKDGAYREPRVDGSQNVLRHVHLIPPSGSTARQHWLKAFRFRGRKTSDRHLIYVQSRGGEYLLIYILDEPTAHEVALMRNSEDRRAMVSFAIVAENFLIDGEVP